MKFIKLSAKNLYSFKELFFEFGNRGTTLILGKNLDQSTSNGAGKSSIIKSIFFALWGKELNGESVDLIRKRDEKDGYIVELEFEDRGHNYKIERYRDRKDKENKTGVDFYIDGKIFNGETSSDTQKIIERKIKISSKLFLSSILTAQNETKHFLTVNDTEKKELFSELLDLTVYSKSFDLVKEEISSKEKELYSINLKIETLEYKIKERKSECENLEEKNDSFEDERVTKEDQLNKKIEDLRNSKGRFDENELEKIEKLYGEKNTAADTKRD
jgi:DNA repair exonuclease SbcCD ATPase subunit